MSGLRALAFIITIGMMKFLRPQMFLELVTSFGLAHYVVGTYVARKKYQEVFLQSFKHNMALGALMMGILISSLIVGVFLPEIAMRWLFGVHFVFSEVFLYKTLTSDLGKELYYATRIHRLLLNVYFYLCYVYMEMVHSPQIYAAIIIGGLMLLALLAVELHKVSGRKWGSIAIDILVFEVLGMIIVPLAQYTRAGYAAVIVYHFVIWWMIPIRLKSPIAHKILGVQFVLSVFFYWLMQQIHSLPGVFATHWTWLIIFGYFHIITTFFISSWNPKFILNWNQKYLWKQSNS